MINQIYFEYDGHGDSFYLISDYNVGIIDSEHRVITCKGGKKTFHVKLNGENWVLHRIG